MGISERAQISFLDSGEPPSTTKVSAKLGQSLMSAAHEAGIAIEATCGGRGRCRSCRVKILDGEVPPATLQDEVQIGREGVRERFRLSCQTKLINDCSVLIAPPRTEAGHQILSTASWAQANSQLILDSGVKKHVATIAVPSGALDPASDCEAFLEALKEQWHGDVPLLLLKKIPEVIRSNGGVITATTFADELISIEPGDTSASKYGMAFDIGTTTIAATLLDLDTGEQRAAVRMMNPQATYGADILSRIAFAQFDAKKQTRLRSSILTAINTLIHDACREADIAATQIYKIVITGNTCMHHIVVGLDPSHLGMAPYNPVTRSSLVIGARELPLKSAPNARICFLPIVAGFVGADTVAAALATRIHESDEVRLLVDIGTNGEVVLGSREKLIACSAPAGPTFEGGQVEHGMRASLGAIEGVSFGADVSCRVVGNVPPIGICGSGLIDTVAKLLDAGLVDPSGVLGQPECKNVSPPLAARLSELEDSVAFVLASAQESGHGNEITITQKDLRQLQLAKAAILCAIEVLQSVMKVPTGQVSELMLAGGFGNYIAIPSALRIALLPALPEDRITYVGNAALTGAQLALVSEAERKEADVIARSIEHVELADHPDFEQLFVSALGFPEPDIPAAKHEDMTVNEEPNSAPSPALRKCTCC